ncbi:MAG: hypothetical protein R2765_11380 [Ferruginibacter sp.]
MKIITLQPTVKLNRKVVMAYTAGKSDSLRILGNNIIGHRDGIYFEFVKNSIIWRNVI